MILSQKTSKFLYWFTFALYIAFIFFVYFTLSDSRLNKIFNSDALYLPVFFQDIFIDKFGFDGIRFNGQPNFFPDMLFYFLFHSFSKNFIVSAIIYSVFQGIVLMVIIYHLIEVLVEKNKYWYSSLLNLLFILILMSGIFGEYLNIRFHLICNGYHTSAFLLAVLGLMYFLKYLKYNKKAPLIFISIITFLGTLNDKIFVLAFVLPFLFSNFILLIKNTDKKTPLKLLIIGFLSATLGELTYRAIIEFTSISFIPQDFSISLEKIKIAFDFASEYLLSQITAFEFHSLILIIAYVSFIISAFMFFKDFFKKTDEKISLYFVFNSFAFVYFVFIYFTPIITGSFKSITMFRYVVSFVYFGYIGLGIHFSRLNIKYTKMPVYFLVAFSVFVLFFYSVKNDIFSGYNKTLHYKPSYVQNIEKIAVDNTDLKLGVSGYWKARQTSMFNDQNLRVYAVFYPKLKPNLWTSRNKYWYFQKDQNSEQRIFNFVVLEKDADSTIFMNIFGADSVQFIKQDNISIVKVPEFIFVEKTKEIKILR